MTDQRAARIHANQENIDRYCHLLAAGDLATLSGSFSMNELLRNSLRSTKPRRIQAPHSRSSPPGH
jgi:hypothetical protein